MVSWLWKKVTTPSMSATPSPASSTARRLASVASPRTERSADRVNAVQPMPVMAVRLLIVCIARLLASVDAAALVGPKLHDGGPDEGIIRDIGSADHRDTFEVG